MPTEHAAGSRLPEVWGEVRSAEVVRDMRQVQEEMNRLFGGLRFIERAEFPPVVRAGAGGAIVTAGVPGVSPDQLEVTVHQDTITLHGKREPEVADGGAVASRK